MWETYFCVRFESRNGRLKLLQSFWYTLYIVVNCVFYNVCILLFGQANVSLLYGTDILVVLVWIIRWFLIWRVVLLTLSLAEQKGCFCKWQYCHNQLPKRKGKQYGCEQTKDKELKQNSAFLWMSGNLCRNVFVAEQPNEWAKVMLQTKYDCNSVWKKVTILPLKE